jgi:hypothetical protein
MPGNIIFVLMYHRHGILDLNYAVLPGSSSQTFRRIVPPPCAVNMKMCIFWSVTLSCLNGKCFDFFFDVTK